MDHSRFTKLNIDNPDLITNTSKIIMTKLSDRKFISLLLFFCIIITLLIIKPTFIYSSQNNSYKTKQFSYFKLIIISLILSLLFYIYPQFKN
jgi:hypothetical protein